MICQKMVDMSAKMVCSHCGEVFETTVFYDHVKNVLNLSKSLDLTKSLSGSHQKRIRQKSNGGNLEIHKQKAAAMMRSVDEDHHPYQDRERTHATRHKDL